MSVERKMKTMYDRCMDENSIEELKGKPLHDAMDTMGGWAITGK